VKESNGTYWVAIQMVLIAQGRWGDHHVSDRHAGRARDEAIAHDNLTEGSNPHSLKSSSGCWCGLGFVVMMMSPPEEFHFSSSVNLISSNPIPWTTFMTRRVSVEHQHTSGKLLKKGICGPDKADNLFT